MQVADALKERAERIYKQYGNVMMDVAGMSKAGIDRKATCRGLFSKLLYLAGDLQGTTWPWAARVPTKKKCCAGKAWSYEDGAAFVQYAGDCPVTGQFSGEQSWHAQDFHVLEAVLLQTAVSGS